MKWFIKLPQKYRNIITIIAWILTFVFGAIFSQIENTFIAVVATAILVASILFSIFAIKANKVDAKNRSEDTSSDADEEKNAIVSNHDQVEKTHSEKSENTELKTSKFDEKSSDNKLTEKLANELEKLFAKTENEKTEEKLSSKQTKNNSYQTISIKDIAEAIPESAYQYNPSINNKVFVFTGSLKHMEREQAYSAVIARGGVVKSSISRKVNYLVCENPSATTTKMKNAYALQEQGYPISIISDDDFMKMLEPSTSETVLATPINYDTITVIDFEVANEQYSSACSLGIVILRDGEIIERQYHLIKPPKNRYLESAIAIHGISPEQTENAETFPKIWDKIKHFFHGKVIAAHNAIFDATVLKMTLKYYGISQPEMVYCDSIYISSLSIPYDAHIGKTLDARCRYLNIPLTAHHNALCDAEACANLINFTYKNLNCNSSYQFLSKYVTLKPFCDVKSAAIIGFAKKENKVGTSIIEDQSIIAN